MTDEPAKSDVKSGIGCLLSALAIAMVVLACAYALSIAKG